ncbi:MAG: TetR family transcriptional regulator [Cellvibrionales bacterium]|nr:TetR family transcriptional regulator [Cellvibrionales bacterium]
MSDTKPEKQPLRQLRKDTLETRRQIVDAAEALFAEHGVDNVTLLDIARASEQKNRNAPQYHFGDKAGLINAVLNKHSDLISVRRKAMMDALAEKESPSLRELADAYVLPLALHIDSTENSLAYLLINCQLMTSKSFAAVTAERTGHYPEVRQLMKMIHRVMGDGNRKQQEFKQQLVQTMVFHGLAGFYSSGDRKHSKAFIDTLCTSVEAVLKTAS